MSGEAAKDTKRRSTDGLFDRYYFGRPGFVNGTVEFHALCGTYIRQGTSILEIGAGPPNPTTRFLASVAGSSDSMYPRRWPRPSSQTRLGGR